MAQKAKGKKTLLKKTGRRSVLSSALSGHKSKKPQNRNPLKIKTATPSPSKKLPLKSGISGRPKKKVPVKGGISGKPPSVFVDNCELPVSYDRTGVTLIARDPQSVFAYWEITPSSLKAVQSEIGASFKKSAQTLRVFDSTDLNAHKTNTRRYFDIDIDPKTQSRYIHLSNDNATVYADLGIKTPKGAFYLLARSNRVSTPCAEESDCLDITWAKVKHPQDSKPSVVSQSFTQPPGSINPIYSSQEFPRKEEQSTTTDTATIKDPSIQTQQENISQDSDRQPQSINEDGKADSLLLIPQQASGTANINGGLPQKAACNEQTMGFNGDSIFQESFVQDQCFPPDNCSSIFKNPVTNDQSYFSELNANMSSAILQGGASEQLNRPHDFFFNVDAELIVYGRTEPGASVMLDDRVILLREDGTFSLRLALPEGELPFAFSAHSSQGSEKKSIALTVKRTTRQGPN
jgi:uncharacterized protein